MHHRVERPGSQAPPPRARGPGEGFDAQQGRGPFGFSRILNRDVLGTTFPGGFKAGLRCSQQGTHEPGEQTALKRRRAGGAQRLHGTRIPGTMTEAVYRSGAGDPNGREQSGTAGVGPRSSGAHISQQHTPTVTGQLRVQSQVRAATRASGKPDGPDDQAGFLRPDTYVLHVPRCPVLPAEVNEGVIRLLNVHEPFPFIWGDSSSF